MNEPWLHSPSVNGPVPLAVVLEFGRPLVEHGAGTAREVEGEVVVGLAQRQHHGQVVGGLDRRDAG